MTEETQAGRDPTDTLVEEWPAVRSVARRVPPHNTKLSDSIALQAEGITIRRNSRHHPAHDVNS
jgi:hypothetical protein